MDGKAGMADLTRDKHFDPQCGSFGTARSPSTSGIVAQVFGVFKEESKKKSGGECDRPPLPQEVSDDGSLKHIHRKLHSRNCADHQGTGWNSAIIS